MDSVMDDFEKVPYLYIKLSEYIHGGKVPHKDELDDYVVKQIRFLYGEKFNLNKKIFTTTDIYIPLLKEYAYHMDIDKQNSRYQHYDFLRLYSFDHVPPQNYYHLYQ